MAEINWNILQPQNIGMNALASFQQGQQMRRETDTRNALGTLAKTPDDQAAMGALMQNNPELGMQYQAFQQKRTEMERQQQARELTVKASQGDPQALQQLVGIDFDTWSKLDGNKRQQLKLQNDYIGQSALRISQLPPEARAQAWDQAISQGVQQGYAGLSRYQGKYSDQALQGAIDNAGLVDKFISLAEPKYMAIPQGGTLVNTRNPQAVASVSGGTPPPQSPAPQSENILTYGQFKAYADVQGIPKAAEWTRQNGMSIRVNTPQEAKQLPRGTRIILPDGSEGVVP